MKPEIIIVDYGMGNIHSVGKALQSAGVSCIVSANPEQILIAQKLILPGVGHFEKAMRNLRNLGLLVALNEAVLKNKTPVLGICLGMQLMAQYSSEGDCEGLGWFDGSVARFDVKDKLRYKVPHIGWNQAEHAKPSALLNGVDNNSEFYFLHSFHYVAKATEEVLMNTNYCYSFASALEKENMYGVQFHPEKSHDAGIRLLKNFVRV